MEAESPARMRNVGPMETFYRHFKGNIYRFVGIAKDSETLEEMVVYQALYGDGQMWGRLREMFFGEVVRYAEPLVRWCGRSVNA